MQGHGEAAVGEEIGSVLSLHDEVSQSENDKLPPSNCWIPLLLATTEDLLLALTASVIVLARFRGGTGGVGVVLAVGEAITA